MLENQNIPHYIQWLLEGEDKQRQQEILSCLPPQAKQAPRSSTFTMPFSLSTSGQYISMQALHPHWIEKALKTIPKTLRPYICNLLPPVLQSKLEYTPDDLSIKKPLQSFLFPFLNQFYEELGLLPAALHSPAPTQIEVLLSLDEKQLQECQNCLALFAITPVLHTVIEKDRREAVKAGLAALPLEKSPIAVIRHFQKNVFITQNPCPHLQFPLHLWDGSAEHLTDLILRYGKGAMCQIIKEAPEDFIERLNKNLAPDRHLTPSSKAISNKIRDDLYKALTFVLSFIEKQDTFRN